MALKGHTNKTIAGNGGYSAQVFDNTTGGFCWRVFCGDRATSYGGKVSTVKEGLAKAQKALAKVGG